MRQLTLATVNFDKHGKLTRRAAFLAEMDRVVPWRELCALIEPFYPKTGNGRPPVGLERMLRLHLLQHWFNLSDPAAEEALYESLSMRQFVGIDLGREPVPDETTILNFRHLLERHSLGHAVFERVNVKRQQSLRDNATRRFADLIQYQHDPCWTLAFPCSAEGPFPRPGLGI
jgi:IS5 family transposase